MVDVTLVCRCKGEKEVRECLTLIKGVKIKWCNNTEIDVEKGVFETYTSFSDDAIISYFFLENFYNANSYGLYPTISYSALKAEYNGYTMMYGENCLVVGLDSFKKILYLYKRKQLK